MTWNIVALDLPVVTDEEVDELPSHLKFSPNRLSKYSECQQLGRYTYEHKLEPSVGREQTNALQLGTITHRFLELWYSDRLHPADAYRVVDKEFTKYEDKLLAATALTIMTRYVQVYKDDHITWKIYAAEKRLIVPYKTPNGTTVYLDGKMDLIAEDSQGNFGLWDHKTSARNTWNADTVLFDPQFNQYLAMLMLCDFMPTYAMVNQIYTGSHDAKKIVSTPRDKLFSRIRINPSPARIEDWLNYIGKQIDQILEQPVAPMNRGHHCTWCPFRNACSLVIDGKNPEPYLQANFKPRKSPNFNIIVDLQGIEI